MLKVQLFLPTLSGWRFLLSSQDQRDILFVAAIVVAESDRCRIDGNYRFNTSKPNIGRRLFQFAVDELFELLAKLNAVVVADGKRDSRVDRQQQVGYLKENKNMRKIT